MSQTLLYVTSRPEAAELLSDELGEGWRVLEARDAAEALATARRESVDVVAAEHDLPAVGGAELLELTARFAPDAARVLIGEHWSVRPGRLAAHLVLTRSASPGSLADGIERASLLRDALGGFGLRALGRRERPRRIHSPGPVSRPLW